MSGNTYFLFQIEQIFRVIGLFKDEGNEVSQAVFKVNEKVSTRQTLKNLKIDKINSETKQIKRKEFGDEIKLIHGESMPTPGVPFK